MPEFAHLPLLLKPEGNGKLSKRDGDRLGFPVFPLEWHDPKSGEISSGYRESGYLPEAVINFLALLGWNPGNDQEVMSMDELIKLFDLHRCSKSVGATKKKLHTSHSSLMKLTRSFIMPTTVTTFSKGASTPCSFRKGKNSSAISSLGFCCIY